MRIRRAALLSLAIVLLLAAACGPAGAPSSQTRPTGAGGTASAGPKRITIAILGVLPAFWEGLSGRGGVVPGSGDFKGLATAGLVVLDDKDALRAQLAPVLPSVE